MNETPELIEVGCAFCDALLGVAETPPLEPVYCSDECRRMLDEYPA